MSDYLADLIGVYRHALNLLTFLSVSFGSQESLILSRLLAMGLSQG